MFKNIRTFVLLSCFLALASGIALAADESLSLEVVKSKVRAAAQLIEAEGESAFPQLRNPGGEFRFADGKGYVWVHNLSGLMLMHPTKPKLERTNMINDKDSTGFPFILAMNRLVALNGEGWVVYLWPKPGKEIEELKASFVKLVKKDNKDYVVGCGMYAASFEYVKSNFPNDVIYSSANFFERQ